MGVATFVGTGGSCDNGEAKELMPSEKCIFLLYNFKIV